MAYKAEFQTQWNNVINSIKVELNKQLDLFGKIDIKKLNETYNLQTQKWSSSIMYEGNWLTNIQNEEFSKKFLNTLHSFKFTVVGYDDKSSVTGYLLSVIVGVGSFFLFKFVFHLGLLISLAAAAIEIILGMKFSASSSKRKINEKTDSLKNEYVKQLEAVEKELAALCEKYDN